MNNPNNKNTPTTPPLEQKHCFYCTNKSGVDWTDVQSLQRFFSHYTKIVPKRRTGLCAKHQRAITKAIKTARIMGLMPFVRS